VASLNVLTFALLERFKSVNDSYLVLKGLIMRRKTILNKEDNENNPDCRNCPYFINKVVCPFRRKKRGEERDSYNSGTSQEKVNGKNLE
jgi:hypothetical protein